MESEELADVIRGTHRQMREAMVKLLSDGYDEDRAWEEIKDRFSVDIKDYAPAMHALGESWRQEADSLQDEPLASSKKPEDHGHLPGRSCHSRWCLDTIREYFWGAAEGKGLISLMAKDKKKAHWESFGQRLTTEAAVQAAIDHEQLKGTTFRGSAGDDSGSSLMPDLPVKVLDVGSCYNPLAQLIDEDCRADTAQSEASLHSAARWAKGEIDVVAVDLSPAVRSVGRCDFVTVPIGALADQCSHQTPTKLWDDADEPGNSVFHEVSVLPRAHFHAIVFSLLLSYIPSPGHRFACCVKAHDLLRLDGLFVVMTPRSTEPKWSRGCPTMKAWRREICSIGFQAWGPVVRLGDHILCLRFRKVNKRQSDDGHPKCSQESENMNFCSSNPDSTMDSALVQDGDSRLQLTKKLYIPADRINGLLSGSPQPCANNKGPLTIAAGSRI